MGADFGKFAMQLIDPGRVISSSVKALSGRSVESMFGGGAFDKGSQESAPDVSGSDIGNLTTEEAAAAASRKLFREGLFFTSPLGIYGSGSRGRSRLMGA